MYMLHRKDIDEYKTIHHEDAELFNEIVNNNLFDKEDKDTGVITRYENKLELITDKAQIKKVLDEKYSSRSRSEDYTAGLPSATVISGGLFPMNIDYKDRGSKFNILRWWNNTSFEDMNAQKVTNKLSLDSGNFIHKIIELCMLSNDRVYMKKRSLQEYIKLACQDKEIIDTISNFEDRKEYFIDMASKTLYKFFENEVEHIHPIFSEIFLKCDRIQGAVDLLTYKHGRLILGDIKTSKKSMSRNQVPEKGYLRQLYLYREMLFELGIINKKEYDTMGQEIYFFNWNSLNSCTYNFEKDEIDKCKAYCEFVLNWFWEIKNS